MAANAAAGLTGMFKPRVAVSRHKKSKALDLLAFFRQMTTLSRSGTPLYQGLQIASEQTESVDMSLTIRGVAEKVAAGASFAEALREYPKIFLGEWCEIIRCGEVAGQLDEVLDRLCKQIEEGQALRSKLIGAMIYPAIVLTVTVGALTVMLTMVVPTFATMFEEFDKELPQVTQSLIAFSNGLRANGLMFLGCAVGGFFGFRYLIRTPRGRRIWQSWLMSLPLIGDLMVQSAMQKFTLNLANLLASGVSIFESLRILEGVFKSNPIYRDAVAQMSQSIMRGRTLTAAMKSTSMFTHYTVNMTRIGEETGTLSSVHAEVARHYRVKIETLVQRMAAQVETLLIVLMAIVVATTLIALYMPMFDLAAGA
jgi:type IV pilus assembly protein PilC